MSGKAFEEIGTGEAPQGAAPENGAGGDETRAQVHRAITAALRDGMTQATLAKQTGLSAPVLSQWLKGNYKGDQTGVQAKLAAWLESNAAGLAVALPSVPTWVNTPTAAAIEKALVFARSSPSIAVIYGVAGAGKTTAIRRYAHTTPNVWIVTATPATSSMAAVLRQIAAVLELPGGYRNFELSRDIVRRLVGARGLLVIDEAQHLTLPALEQVRSIHDAAGVGVALCGNESVYSRLSGGTRRAEFAQLFSRAAPKLRLTSPQAGDVAAILEAWGVTGAAELKFAQQIASLPGGLRGLVKTLEQAALFSVGALSPDVAMMRAAWNELGGAA